MFTSRLSVVRWLWTHNPFYFLSALLMLYAVRSGYGEQHIGTIDCWMMMGVLAGYTLVLSVIGVLIVRYGKVWDDARSILLLLLLLFLAVSVSADDLFVKMESMSGGVALLGFGFLFSVAVMLLTLRGAGIRLGAAYLIPFVLFLGLFYVMPWWCSPELNPRPEPKKVDWVLFLIPQAAALLCLTLIPAVRLGRRYTANNGTPWSWPWFPWTAFGMIVTAMAFRSYALTLTFSPTGMIWVSPDSRFGIVLDTIWRPYFLVPFALANLLLILEAGLASGNARLVRRALLAVPAVMVMAWPWYQTDVMLDFLNRLTVNVASPVWLAVWLVALFYGWAMLRRVPGAEFGLLGSVLLFSVIGPHTNGLSTLAAVNPWPLLGVSAIVAVVGLRRRSTEMTLTAAALMTLSVWFLLPSTLLAAYRMTVCYHALFATVLLLSLFHRDRLALLLRHVGAILLPLTALVALAAPAAAEVPLPWRLSYVAGLVGVAYVCAHVSRSPTYWIGCCGTLFAFGYGLTMVVFREAASRVGREAITAFSCSCGTLLIGVLISAYKAHWLPQHLWPKWLLDGGTGDGGVPIENVEQVEFDSRGDLNADPPSD